jgi:hypothetical protein
MSWGKRVLYHAPNTLLTNMTALCSCLVQHMEQLGLLISTQPSVRCFHYFARYLQIPNIILSALAENDHQIRSAEVKLK